MAVVTQNATIPAGASISNAVNCNASTPVRVRMPAKWTGGDRGKITFQISTDDITYMDYFNPDGSEVSATVTPGSTTRVEHPIGSHGGTYIKIRTGTRDSPVVQADPVTFVVVSES